MIPLWLSVQLSVFFYILSVLIVFSIGENSKNNIKKLECRTYSSYNNYNQNPYYQNEIKDRIPHHMLRGEPIHRHPQHLQHHHPPVNHQQQQYYGGNVNYNKMTDVNINFYDDYCLTPNLPDPLSNGGSIRNNNNNDNKPTPRQTPSPFANINYF